jgi:hypothetical protein
MVGFPDNHSLNGIMSHTGADQFYVNMVQLQEEAAWAEALDKGLNIFQLGAGYDFIIKNNYFPYYDYSYDHLVYIEESSPTDLLW